MNIIVDKILNNTTQKFKIILNNCSYSNLRIVFL